MKILMVNAYYYPSVVFGGPIWSARSMAKMLKALDHEVTIVTTNADLPKDREGGITWLDGLKVINCKRTPTSKWFFSEELKNRVEEEIEAQDLLYINGIWTYPTFTACRAARKYRKSYIISIRGSLDEWAVQQKNLKKLAYLTLFEERNLRLASAVHCLTGEEEKQVKKFVPNANCVVIPNVAENVFGRKKRSCKDEVEKEYPEIRGKTIVLFMSRLHKKKGLDLLARAFARIAAWHQDVHLVIAGPDEDGSKAEIERILAESHMANRVTFCGIVEGDLKIQLIERADLFALTSYSEGLPMAVLEALSFGKPVIVSRQTNLGDNIEKYGAGIVVDTDVDSISRGLEDLVADKGKRKRMGNAAIELTEAAYSEKKIISDLAVVLENARKRKTQDMMV
jgi:glycosyltransferase involved in cell wall biosynthesis